MFVGQNNNREGIETSSEGLVVFMRHKGGGLN